MMLEKFEWIFEGGRMSWSLMENRNSINKGHSRQL